MTQVDKLRAKGMMHHWPGIRRESGLPLLTVIDYLHPALGGCYGKDCLVSFGHDSVGDAYNGTNTSAPGEDPMDCRGHRSHVAGIIAAQNNTYGFTGTAPGVSLGAYRVFGCSGSGGNDVLIAAFNKAYQDGANIITASGVPCVVSAGNDGDQGVFYASSPADGQHVSAIASFDNLQIPSVLHLSKYQVDDGPEQSFGYVPSKLSNLWDDLSKSIVLIRRGTCSFSDKARNAIAKGANSEPPDAISAASMVDAETGETFIKALEGGKRLTFKMVGPKNAEVRILTANNSQHHQWRRRQRVFQLGSDIRDAL
ncbi:hypothetical protein E4U33_000587 [Claviceps sp. LM78 group G4]|nr:hypothetical protein E4U33_000587 [Claviceps sp. LM78 group G4]